MRHTRIAAAAVFLVVTGCAGNNPVGESTTQVREVQPAGFLGETYALLREGRKGEATLVYWNENVDFSSYTKAIVDPVTIWAGENFDVEDIDPEERQQLANEFHAALVAEISQVLEITNAAGPDTLRIRVALTDAQDSSPVLDTISTYVPQARLVQTVLTLGSDTAGFVGEASAEGVVYDTLTNEILAAGVDRRAGTKALGDDTFSGWADVRRAFEAWSVQFVRNLRERRIAVDE